ncbi:MAG: sensor histidine kinase [Acidimicrobiales bacterium]
MKRSVVGTALALASMAGLTSAMLPLRSHLSVATTALVLVVPVVVGVVSGGFLAGAISVIAGFLTYDFFFIPPYLTLTVGEAQNWTALGVYAVVMLLVARVVAVMNAARADARRQGNEIRRLFELSDLLVEDKPLEVLLSVIVTTLAEVFNSARVSLLLPFEERLEVVAYAGEPLTDGELQQVIPSRGNLASLDARHLEPGRLLVLALTAAGRPVGLLVLSGEAAAPDAREPLLLFANQIALAVERAQLREQALRTRLTEEIARLAKTLVAAVSHDLRTPLASIKASSSTLADAELSLSAETRQGLVTLIDVQADRLAELVQNLLDMSRIQAGVLEPRRTVISLTDLFTPVLTELGPLLRGHSLALDLAADLPLVDVDLVLISRVLTNLVENAVRHAPKTTLISIRAVHKSAQTVEVAVTDQGPGVEAERRKEIFGLFARRDGDAGAGLGLTIAETFVQAHGQHIWVEDAPEGGARFCFTLPVAESIPEEESIGADAHH